MNRIRFAPRIPALVAGAVALLTGSALAQVQAPPFDHLDYLEDSGYHENTGGAPRVVLSFPVVVDKAQWLRLYFEEVTLSGDLLAGEGSILRMTALEDGAIQEMDARHLRQWQNSSAYFNGDTVLVEVLAQPGTGFNRVATRAVDAGLIPTTGTDKSICGPTDDRQLSYDDRACRLLSVGCTGWLIDDCAHCFMTAGHCAYATSVAQFNVPLSDSNGSINNPPPEDQYAVDPSSMQDNGGNGVGDDWAYFGCHPNTNTGLTAAEAQGVWYTVVDPPPVSGTDIRITGYGVDSSPSSWNQVQQTHVGPMATSSGSVIQYVTDTMGGNSGSPVIWEQTDQAIGIHTHGGCDSSGGQNSGTGSNNGGLQNALANPQGVCAAGIYPVGTLPSLVPPGVPVPFEVEVLGTPATGTPVELHYRLSGGSFQALAMSPLGGGYYGADMPAPSCGDTPDYYFSYTDETCGLATNPKNAPSSFYSMTVGIKVVAFEDDFQTDKGWTAENLGATSGFWQRGIPVNDPNWAYDPTSDSDGSGRCYLTQNVTGNTDVDDGAVRLTSPIFDFSDPSGQVSYDYFLNLTNTDGTDRLLVEGRSDGGIWQTVAVHDTDGELSWRTHSILHADFVNAGVTPSDQTELRFTANDGDTQSIVEAGVDAFFVGAIECGTPIGTNYCQMGLNLSAISATGSTSVAANDVLLRADSVPLNQFGIFYYGDNQIQVPFGQGYRCVGGTAGVFRLGPPVNSGASGVMLWQLDLTDPPLPAGQILAGSTWNFQAWFRDGTLFDLSDGLSITFIP